MARKRGVCWLCDAPKIKGGQLRLVLTERQANSLLVYGRMVRDHGAGRDVARDFRAIVGKVERALRRADDSNKEKP